MTTADRLPSADRADCRNVLDCAVMVDYGNEMMCFPLLDLECEEGFQRIFHAEIFVVTSQVLTNARLTK